MPTIQTLCLVRKGNYILLAMKKKGRMGVGYWNGLGGHVEEGESIEEAACREPEEEAKIKVLGLYKAGVILFRFPDGKEFEVHIFGANDCEGDPQETDEMRPQWFPVDGIPYEQMWPADRHWLPIFLTTKPGKLFKGSVLFGESKEVRDWDVDFV